MRRSISKRPPPLTPPRHLLRKWGEGNPTASEGEGKMITTLAFDVGHLLAGLMLVLSFLLLYQDRILATLNVFALQAIVLAGAVAWQARVQNAPHLYVTAAVALSVKGFIIPTALHRIVRRLQIHREIEQVVGAGPLMLLGLGLVALSIMLVLPRVEGV